MQWLTGVLGQVGRGGRKSEFDTLFFKGPHDLQSVRLRTVKTGPVIEFQKVRMCKTIMTTSAINSVTPARLQINLADGIFANLCVVRR
jgi:hypothetical protein